MSHARAALAAAALALAASTGLTLAGSASAAHSVQAARSTQVSALAASAPTTSLAAPFAVAANPVASAAAIAKKYLSAKTPYEGPKSGPRPKKGLKVAIISCLQATTGCHRPSVAAAAAAKAIGWKATIFDGQGQPSTQLQAVESAVNGGYNAIIVILIDVTNIAEGLKQAHAKHIPVITLGEPNYNSARKAYPWIPDVSHDWLGTGKVIGDYMIWKSNGKANALLLDDNSTLVVQQGQFKGTYMVLTNKTMCPGCKVKVEKFTQATLTTQPAQEALADVQADPSLNWIWCYDFCLFQAITKLKASGVGSNLLGAGFDCNAENLNLMKTKVIQTVCAADARDWEAWATIDEANRLTQGKPAVAENPPFRLIDRGTITDLTKLDLADGWQGGFDYKTQFKKIWGVQ